ncbi:MAG: putative Lipoprotein [Acidimicrobiales bacterium]|nr:putative Lipoprotein [Acidimicrobiales bacterium]
MHRRISAILLGLAVIAVACGAPKSGNFSAIPLGNLPDGLTATTSTTTTTTTSIPETTSTVESVVTTTTLVAPTTTNPTEAVTLYFVADAGTQLVPTRRFLASPAQPYPVLNALKEGPVPVVDSGLRTAIPPDAVFQKRDYRGVFTVDLSPTFFTSMANPADEQLAVAQIVLTLTGLRGISQVRFTINDEPINVLLGDGQPSALGQVLVADDYDVLLGNSPSPTTTTTTTIVDTVPPATVPADPTASTPAAG